jgi:hypothetical protein
MRLSELMKPGGKGVIATSSSKGEVNTAIYAMPHVIDEETLAWGMTDNRTYENVRENPHASYLYMNTAGFSGCRISLRLKKIEDAGEMLESIRSHTAGIVGPEAASAVTHVAYFSIVEIRPLI